MNKHWCDDCHGITSDGSPCEDDGYSEKSDERPRRRMDDESAYAEAAEQYERMIIDRLFRDRG